MVYFALAHLSDAADKLAEREYQTQQALLAQQASERLADVLTNVGRHLEQLQSETPRTDGAWLTTAPTSIPTLLFLHDSNAEVLAVPPNAPAEQRAWIEGGAAKPLLSVTRPLRGHEDLYVTALLDQRGIHEQLFASIGQTHNAYVWVMDRYRTIVSAPTPSDVGSRPFEELDPETERSIEPTLAAMSRAETGTASYRWRDGDHVSTRLIAFTGVRGRDDLAVAYSADRASVLELTRELHERETLILLLLFGLLGLIGTAVAVRAIQVARAKLREAAQLGPYTLGRELGRGGMGVVHEAQHALLRRPTAIKLIPPDRRVPAALERFEREVQHCAELTHPNTITIYDYGKTDDGVFYYAMELVDGPTLREVVIDNGPLPVARAVHVLEQIADALREAHHSGLIHRDLKPENIMLCERGGYADVVKVLDFGLVLRVGEDAGKLVGTPAYMSPETISGGDVVAKTDVYALAAIAYYLVTGHDVFEGKSAMDICRQHVSDTPISPATRLGAEIPSDLESLILSGLAKQPDDRPDIEAFQTALRASELFGQWSQELARAQPRRAKHTSDHPTRTVDRVVTMLTLDQ